MSASSCCPASPPARRPTSPLSPGSCSTGSVRRRPAGRAVRTTVRRWSTCTCRSARTNGRRPRSACRGATASSSGRGHGHTAILGRHLAAARATADALRQVLRADLVVEHVLLSYPPMDAELVVATVLVGARRFVGATAADPGDEEAAAARAVLDALNRNLGEID